MGVYKNIMIDKMNRDKEAPRHPILFSTPMVLAILNGSKTQTRRVVKIPDLIEHPDRFHYKGNSLEFDIPVRAIPYDYRLYHSWDLINSNEAQWVTHSYSPGDILWVRETWHPKRHNMPTGWKYEYKATAEEDGNPTDGPWKPSIFMPFEACRLFLEVTNIKVERLWDISSTDARNEGIENQFDTYLDYLANNKTEKSKISNYYFSARDSFFSLWEMINGKDSVLSNPWVWVISFKISPISLLTN